MDPGGHVKVQFQVDPFFRKRSKDRSKALGSKAITTKEDEPLVRHKGPPAPPFPHTPAAASPPGVALVVRCFAFCSSRLSLAPYC